MGSPTLGYQCVSISRACGFEWSLGIAHLPAVQWLILVCGQKQDMSGVPLGEHPVEIHAIEVLNAGSQRRHVPALYENHELSKLRVKIDGATEALVINLTWQGSGKKGPYVESFGKE